MSKYTKKIDELPWGCKCSMFVEGGVLTTSYVADRLEKLDSDPPTVDLVADALRHGEELDAHIFLLWMIVNGKDVGETVKIGDVETPLLVYAAGVNAYDVSLLLIAQKVDVNAVDSNGFSALYNTTDEDIAKALRAAGAKEICREDLVKVDQDKVISVKMTKYERMALCDMATYALTPATDYDYNLTALAAWYLLDYMLENSEHFSFLSFVYVLANSHIELPVYDECDTNSRLETMTNAGYMTIEIPGDSLYQFRKLSYEDPKLSFHVDPTELMHHPTDDDGNLLKDLILTGPIYLMILKETLEAVDTEILARKPWGSLILGFQSGRF